MLNSAAPTIRKLARSRAAVPTMLGIAASLGRLSVISLVRFWQDWGPMPGELPTPRRKGAKAFTLSLASGRRLSALRSMQSTEGQRSRLDYRASGVEEVNVGLAKFNQATMPPAQSCSSPGPSAEPLTINGAMFAVQLTVGRHLAGVVVPRSGNGVQEDDRANRIESALSTIPDFRPA